MYIFLKGFLCSNLLNPSKNNQKNCYFLRGDDDLLIKSILNYNCVIMKNPLNILVWVLLLKIDLNSQEKKLSFHS